MEPSAETGTAHSTLPQPGTYHRCFRWGDPETLGQDSGKVGGPGPMPQQPSVMQLLERLVALALPFTLYLKDLVGILNKRERRRKPFVTLVNPGI